MMQRKLLNILIITIIQAFLTSYLHAQTTSNLKKSDKWMVRLAKLEIDIAFVKEYNVAVKEHTETALKVEPGVLTLYAMFEKAHPEKVTVLEVYADKDAYLTHIKTPHFLKYKTTTLHMVKSLELIDVDPIAFKSKPDFLLNLVNSE